MNVKDRMNAFKEASAPSTSSTPLKNKPSTPITPSTGGSLKDRANAFNKAAASSSPASSNTSSPYRTPRAPPTTPGSGGSLKARAEAFKAASSSSSHSPKVTTGKGYSSASKKVGSVSAKANAFKALSSQPFTKDSGGPSSPDNKDKDKNNGDDNNNDEDDDYSEWNDLDDNNSSYYTPKVVSFSEAALMKLNDKSNTTEVESYLQVLKNSDGITKLNKRLSIRDNDIVTDMNKIMINDPCITKLEIQQDPRFRHLSSTLLLDFAERGLRLNWHLTTLSLTGVELDNTFLSCLATSCELNFTLQTIDLHNNSFTNDGLVEFCCSIGTTNDTVTSINLKTQYSPIFKDSQDIVLDALRENKVIQNLEIDFKSKSSGTTKLQEILTRNQKSGIPTRTKQDEDKRLLTLLSKEAERSKELYEQKQTFEDMLHVTNDDDWDYLYELALMFDRFKLEDEDVEDDEPVKNNSTPDRKAPRRVRSQIPPPKRTMMPSPSGGKLKDDNRKKVTAADKNEEKEDSDKSNKNDGENNEKKATLSRSNSEPKLQAVLAIAGSRMTADGEFLNEDFITQYLVENLERNSLLFDFRNQFKMFKRFPITDTNRLFIVSKFVDTLLTHPRSQDITGINMANTCCGNDFLEILSEKCLENPKDVLPKLQSLNAETNFITESGVVALAKCIENPKTMKYLQVLKLENQKKLLSSKGEMSLAKAICVNRGIIRLSMRIRNLLEREQINKYVQRNLDFVRQARRHHAIKTGTLEERKRNEMEQYFDKIAGNDPSITEVEIIGNLRFLSLNEEEKVKAGIAFATNTHVTTVLMSTLKLDCKFAQALGKSLETNSTIEKINLDSNAIAGDGIKALYTGLAKNSTVTELQVRHQSKVIPSGDEIELATLLAPNITIAKLGIDLRNQIAKINIEKKMSQNHDLQRKARRRVQQEAAAPKEKK